MSPNSLLITARYSSSRLPRKLLLSIGENTVLGHCILRALSAGFDPILCTSTASSDDVLVSEASKYGISAFRGDLFNKLRRWDDCFAKIGLTHGHILDADDPFLILKKFIRASRNFNLRTWILFELQTDQIQDLLLLECP